MARASARFVASGFSHNTCLLAAQAPIACGAYDSLVGADVADFDGRMVEQIVDRDPALRDALPGWARIVPIIHSRAIVIAPTRPQPSRCAMGTLLRSLEQA
jgi:hypothetical protein